MKHLTDQQFRELGDALDKALAEHTREHNRRLFGENEMVRRKYRKGDKTMNEQINEAINNFDNEIVRIFREQSTGTDTSAPLPDESFRTRLISIADAIDERLGGEIG